MTSQVYDIHPLAEPNTEDPQGSSRWYLALPILACLLYLSFVLIGANFFHEENAHHTVLGIHMVTCAGLSILFYIRVVSFRADASTDTKFKYPELLAIVSVPVAIVAFWPAGADLAHIDSISASWVFFSYTAPVTVMLANSFLNGSSEERKRSYDRGTLEHLRRGFVKATSVRGILFVAVSPAVASGLALFFTPGFSWRGFIIVWPVTTILLVVGLFISNHFETRRASAFLESSVGLTTNAVAKIDLVDAEDSTTATPDDREPAVKRFKTSSGKEFKYRIYEPEQASPPASEQQG